MPEMFLECPACHGTFPFTEEDQAYCAEHAFPPPTYCPDCHRARKSVKDDAKRQQHRGGRRRK